jgi:hypothetical protein
LVRVVTLRDRDDRRNIAALAVHLGVCPDDAARLYRRSREVGYPTAFGEFQEAGGARRADASPPVTRR